MVWLTVKKSISGLKNLREGVCSVLCQLPVIADCVFTLQVAVHFRNQGGAGGDMRVSTGTGQKGRTDSPASGGGGETDPGGVWTLPHEDNQLSGESQSGLCTH